MVYISFPWSLTREIPGQSPNLTGHLFSLKAHAGGVLLFQNSLDMNRSPHRVCLESSWFQVLSLPFTCSVTLDKFISH